MGNFVEHFECLVCEREVIRMRNRFRPVPHVARLDHYGCPAPETVLAGVGDVTGWLVDFAAARVEAEALARTVKSGKVYSAKR